MKKIFSILLTAVIALAVTSCVKDEIYPYASVAKLTNTDSKMGSAVTVTAQTESLVGVNGVTLFYNVAGGAFKSVAMTGSNNVYTAEIPADAAEEHQAITYYVEVVAKTGNVTKSAINKFNFGEAPIDYTGLRLNELNGNDKFIELYNAGDHDIYIAGITMYKDGGDASTWTGPKVNIKKGEYIVLYSEDVQDAHSDVSADYIFHSGLSAKKSVQITIKSPAGVVLSDFNLDNSAGTKYAGSFGLNADGKWYSQTTATPGAVNVDGTEALKMK